MRNKLVNGELDAAHVLYGLIYGVQLGISRPRKDMSLNDNGQAITLSNQLKEKGATGHWIDASLGNKQKTAETIARRSYVNTDTEVIAARMLGRYANGLGKSWDDKNHMKFYNDGAVSYPDLSDGMWFMTQHKRWGLLKDHPDNLAVTRKVNRTDIYGDAPAAVRIAHFAGGADGHPLP